MPEVKDLIQNLDSILKELEDTSLGDLSPEDVIELRKATNPYGRTIEGSDNYLTYSFTDLEGEYKKKLLMTGFIAFFTRMCDEWHVPDNIPVIPVYEYLDDPTKITSFSKSWKIDEKTQRDIDLNKKWMQKRVIVKEFLEELFQFNPDKHIRSSYKANPQDKDRLVVNTPAANLAIKDFKKKDVKFREQMIEYDRVQSLINMGSDLTPEIRGLVADKLVLPEYNYSTMDFAKYTDKDKNALREACMSIPPIDIFGRFKNYYENNFDKLQEAVQYLYCDKPELDLMLNPHSWHSTRDEAEEFQKKHRNEVVSDIIIARSGAWNVFSPHTKVRESMKYFNDNTIVLEEIAKQVESDSKIGQDLMKNRVKIQKKKNIAEEGPDAEFFTKWKEQNTTLKDMGAIDVNKDSRSLLDDEDDAVQVDVFHFKDGGVDVEKSHFFSKAMAPTTGGDEAEDKPKQITQ
jgi:hypothetical protein